MNKPLLSALGLAIALALSMPIIGASSANATTMHTTVKKHHRHHRLHRHYRHHHKKVVAKKY
ncbi:hypothetical protein NKH80_17155 [Mesorhizobium sp. M0904]|uniref:hypothetical protein n=1 Tax=unclassified Mesorhizobium TaxID=325217 RepID=UPI003339A6A0